ILALAEHFARKYAQANAVPERLLADDTKRRLLAHRWPGNVRELNNRVRRALVMAEGRLLTPHDLDLESPTDKEAMTLDLVREEA
ncbi:sigma-54-dependent Fis family transcriptional regulator, partial [Pseudomonas sp. FW301-21B01]